MEPARTMMTGVLRETRGGKVEVLAMAIVPRHERYRTSEPHSAICFIPLRSWRKGPRCHIPMHYGTQHLHGTNTFPIFKISKVSR